MRRSPFLIILGAFTIVCIGSILLLAKEAETNGLPAVRPHWTPGDEWYVQCITPPQERSVPPSERDRRSPVQKGNYVYRFRVVRIADVGGVRCYEVLLTVMMSGGKPDQSKWHRILCFREDDLALIRIDEYRGLREPHTGEFRSWPCFPIPLDGVLPLYWPAFDKAAAPKEKLQPAAGYGVMQKASAMAIPGTAQPGVEVVLSHTQANGEVLRQAVQEWAQGKPWWVSARHIRNDTPSAECKLLTWGEVWRLQANEDQQQGVAEP